MFLTWEVVCILRGFSCSCHRVLLFRPSRHPRGLLQPFNWDYQSVCRHASVHLPSGWTRGHWIYFPNGMSHLGRVRPYSGTGAVHGSLQDWCAPPKEMLFFLQHIRFFSSYPEGDGDTIDMGTCCAKPGRLGDGSCNTKAWKIPRQAISLTSGAVKLLGAGDASTTQWSKVHIHVALCTCRWMIILLRTSSLTIINYY